MRILVCGGAGFIGSAFVRRRLRATDDEIVVLDKLTYAGNEANLAEVRDDSATADRHRFVHGDIADPDAVRAAIMDQPLDAIVNFAAESHVDRSILDAEAFLRTGVIGVHVLLEAARTLAQDPKQKGRTPLRFVQVSTDEVYGSVETGFSSETDPLRPRSPYSAAKAAGDLLVGAYHETYGLHTLTTRGANTYGPYQYPEKIVPLFTLNALRHRELPLYGDGHQERDWLHVDDHADAVSLVLDRGVPGQVYNVPGSGPRTNREITERILTRLDRPWTLVRRVLDRPGHDRRYAMDGARLRALGWTPRVPFEQGLADTVDWYRDHEAWWRPLLGEAWTTYYDRQYAQRLADGREA